MASLCLNSLSLPPSSQPRKLIQTSLSSSSSSSSSSSLFIDNNNNHNTPSPLKPIVVNGDPPSFVSAPGRRILAVGDLHGDLKKARSALEMAGVLSSDGQDIWTGGESVLVQLGDILDRGGDEIAILSLLQSLDKQAKAEGGAIFQVNGNHETMNVEGDFRYVDYGGFDECDGFVEYINESDDAWDKTFTGWLDVSKKLKEDRTMSRSYWGPWDLVKRQKGVIARSILFRPGGPLARELSKHPVVLVVNDWVFCHGGLLPHHVEYGIERMNKEVSEWMRGLNENDNSPPFIATRGYDSVVWNRLYSRDSPDLVDYQANQSVLEMHFSIKRISQQNVFFKNKNTEHQYKRATRFTKLSPSGAEEDRCMQPYPCKRRDCFEDLNSQPPSHKGTQPYHCVEAHPLQNTTKSTKKSRNNETKHYDLQISSILEETLRAVGAKAMVVGHTPQTIGVLEIINNTARVIRSKRDNYIELQSAAYT
ncbi:hypothetical protein Lal_00048344 [Lupinus albus]|nr:hypothetical protein Lal_00048344 [Lupinus albus]